MASGISDTQSAELLIARAIADAIRPDPPLSVWKWADEYRMLSSKAASAPGNGGASGEPRPDEAVQAVFGFDDVFTMKIAGAGRPVSTIDPKSFLPVYGTDESAVGGPVGGPIPNHPGRFYATSNSSPWLGQQTKVGDRRFVFTGASPFNKYWEEAGGRETPGR